MLLTSTATDVCSDGYSSTVVNVCFEYGIPLILSCIFTLRFVFPKFSKRGRLLFLLDWQHYAKQQGVCSSCFDLVKALKNKGFHSKK